MRVKAEMLGHLHVNAANGERGERDNVADNSIPWCCHTKESYASWIRDDWVAVLFPWLAVLSKKGNSCCSVNRVRPSRDDIFLRRCREYQGPL